MLGITVVGITVLAFRFSPTVGPTPAPGIRKLPQSRPC